jgi:hypothetical protein
MLFADRKAHSQNYQPKEAFYYLSRLTNITHHKLLLPLNGSDFIYQMMGVI